MVWTSDDSFQSPCEELVAPMQDDNIIRSLGEDHMHVASLKKKGAKNLYLGGC